MVSQYQILLDFINGYRLKYTDLDARVRHLILLKFQLLSHLDNIVPRTIVMLLTLQVAARLLDRQADLFGLDLGRRGWRGGEDQREQRDECETHGFPAIH